MRCSRWAKGHGFGQAGHHREVEFGFERALEDDTVGVHQRKARSGAQEGDRCCAR